MKNEKQYVTFEQAKFLKVLGFPQIGTGVFNSR